MSGSHWVLSSCQFKVKLIIRVAGIVVVTGDNSKDIEGHQQKYHEMCPCPQNVTSCLKLFDWKLKTSKDFAKTSLLIWTSSPCKYKILWIYLMPVSRRKENIQKEENPCQRAFNFSISNLRDTLMETFIAEEFQKKGARINVGSMPKFRKHFETHFRSQSCNWHKIKLQLSILQTAVKPDLTQVSKKNSLPSISFVFAVLFEPSPEVVDQSNDRIGWNLNDRHVKPYLPCYQNVLCTNFYSNATLYWNITNRVEMKSYKWL